ncbi:UNVERIFIED_CONTAM: hypothetical protein GTU68_025294 [Idotea baltica]|nr:hypothetical protein [Idotea baltica]
MYYLNLIALILLLML